MPTHNVTHPFCRYERMDGDIGWSVGCEVIQDRMGGDAWIAHGEGVKVITEISRHTPPGYGEKVFFSVEYLDPDGKKAGRKQLKMLGVRAYNRRVSGFYFDYEVQ